MKILKPYHEITLKDVILLDATKSANVLKKYWFIPLFLCRKELESLAKQIVESIGGKTVKDLQNEFNKLESYRTLQILEILYKSVQIEFEIKSRINAWRIIFEKECKESTQLSEILLKVEHYTRIKIETPENLKDFYDYVQFRIDKFEEMYQKEEVEERPETPLIDIFYSVFNYLGEPFNDEMLLIAFLSMRKMATERIAKQSNTDENELC